MTRIENTSDRDPLLHLAGAWGGEDRISNYITEMESAGQSQLVHSDRLPTDTHGTDDAFTALGFTFGEPDAGDPMFRPATLPEGWTRQGSDHAMWSYLLDDKGRKRVSIFYKAAFYDRSAHMSVVNPASVISDLFYADHDPTSLPLDDLLTAELARESLNSARAQTIDYIERWTESVAAGLVPQSAVDEKAERLRRIDAMIELLP